MPEARQRAEGAYRALVSLPQAEQGRRMAEVRDAMLNCRAFSLDSTLPADTP